MSEKILGIDLGTTNSLVGVVDSGFPILFADKNGSRITPSVVSYSNNDDPNLQGSDKQSPLLSRMLPQYLYRD